MSSLTTNKTFIAQRKYISTALVSFIIIALLYTAGGTAKITLPAALRRTSRVAATLAYSNALWEISVARRAALLNNLRTSQNGQPPVGFTAFDHGRHTIWDLFPPNFNSPYPIERVGKMGEGGKFVAGLDRIAREKDCVMYSFGVERDSSAELGELLDFVARISRLTFS